VQRIDSAGVRRSSVGRDDQGLPAGLGIGLDGAGERVDPNPVCVVGG
jgi:hypothetical protein